jgi:invasion protein IalB
MARFAGAVLAALLALVATAGTAAAQGELREAFGDWQMRCEQPAGAPAEQCAIVQNVTAEDRENVGLTVIFLRTADGQVELLRVLAPLGVLLPSGLGLVIDDEDVGRAGFVRCLPNGCIAEIVLEEELVARLRGGDVATFIIFQTPEEGIGIPISLDGFSEGFDALP